MVWIVLVILFLFTRVPFLGVLPIFNDEATYLRWGWEMIQGIKPWWYPIAINGKPPLTMLLYGLVQVFPIDPLIAGRLLAICFSAITVFVSVKTFAILFPKRSILLYGLLLIFNPFLLFFDRLTLSETMITAFGSLLLYAAVRYAGTRKLQWILVVSVLFGIGWWVKTTIFVFVPAFVILLVWLGIMKKISWKQMIQDVVVGIFVMFLLIYPSSFHPDFSILDAGEAKWIFSFPELLHIPIPIWMNNAKNIGIWLFVFPTPLYILCWIVGAIHLFQQPRYRNVFLLYSAWVGIPILLFLLFGKNLTARYFVIFMPQLTIFSALVLHRKLFQRVAIVFVISVSFLIIMKPRQYFQMISVFPRAYFDMAQYMTGWPSGYGVREAIAFLKEEAQKTPLVVFVRNDTGNPEDAAFVYLRDNSHVTIIPVIQKDDVMRKLAKVPKEIPAYFLSRGPALLGINEELKELVRFPKPDGVEYVGIYHVSRK